jgi:hypothetical protein
MSAKPADWMDKAPDKDFERFPTVDKTGEQTVKFLDNGNLVPHELTDYENDSVVFNVEQEKTKKELWFSINHPILRLLKKAMPLEGKTAVIAFEGKGRNKLANLKSLKE